MTTSTRNPGPNDRLRYDDLPIRLEFTHGDWDLIATSLQKAWGRLHDEADRLESSPNAAASAERIAGCRVKATRIFEVTADVMAAMAAARAAARGEVA